MQVIEMSSFVGDFGEDKDAAAFMRESDIKPLLAGGMDVTLDFSNVDLVTQSFIHALISDVLRTFGESSLEQILFANCNEGIKGIISTVVQYSLDSMSDDPP